jgi:uncharacterized protein YdaU (DUF1376 family)
MDVSHTNHIPYFNFYPSDFMSGTRGLTAQEVGVYIMLMCLIYEEDGPVENNELRLSTYCGMRIPTFRKTLEKLIDLGKVYEAGGALSNRRAEAELAKRAETLKKNSKAGKAGAKKSQQNQSPEATPVERPINHTDTETDTVKEREATASPKNTRGSRLSEDWALPRDWADWAASEGFATNCINEQADRFRDYWVAKAGSGGMKLDWFATWRNWMRNSNGNSQQTSKETGNAGNSKSNQRVAAFLAGARGS